MPKNITQEFSVLNSTLKSTLANELEAIVEAAIFASNEPINDKKLAHLLPEKSDLENILNNLKKHYSIRGINLQKNMFGWFFITSPNVGTIIKDLVVHKKQLTKSGLEILAIIAWHQPITRGEIEAIRGVSLSSSSLDALMEANLVRPLGKRLTANHPLEWGTTALFLQTFGLHSIQDLPGIDELRKSGFMPDITKESNNPILQTTSESTASLFDTMNNKLKDYNFKKQSA